MMICRIFYSNKTKAEKQNLPRVGTKYEIDTMEDLRHLMKELEESVIIHEHELPWWLENKLLVYGEDWLKTLDEDVVEDEYLVEFPTEDWVMCQWIEVYNGYRE